MNINKKVSILRRINGLTVAQFSTAVGSSEKTVEKWEENQSIDFDSIRRIATYFEISLDYLVEDKPVTSNDNVWLEKIKKFQAEQDTKNECNILIEKCKKYLSTIGCNYDECVLPSYKDGKIDNGAFIIGQNGELSLDKNMLTEMKQAELLKKLFSKAVSIDAAIKADDKELIDAAFSNYDRQVKYYADKKAKGEIEEKRDYFGRRLKSEDEVFFENNNLADRLEKLTADLDNYYYLIVCLIDRGACYYKQEGYGDDVTCFNDIEDKSKTEFIYRVAKDMLALTNVKNNS